MTDLPQYWDSMDVGALWDELNHPARFSEAAAATFNAVVWSLIHNNGLRNARVRAANLRRLSQFSDRHLHNLIDTLHRKHCDPDVIAEIESYL